MLPRRRRDAVTGSRLGDESGSYRLGDPPLTVLLVRHADAAWTVDGRSVDRPGLSEAGDEQAALLGRRLGALAPLSVVVSPQERATATALRAGLTEPRRADWLEETRYPRWDGVPADTIARRLREVRELPAEAAWDHSLGDGAETPREFHYRIVAGLTAEASSWGMLPGAGRGLFSLGGTPPPGPIVLIAHAGSLGVCLAWLLGLPDVPWARERFQLPHASVTTLDAFRLGPDFAFSVRCLGDDAHLPAALRSR